MWGSRSSSAIFITLNRADQCDWCEGFPVWGRPDVGPLRTFHPLSGTTKRSRVHCRPAMRGSDLTQGARASWFCFVP
jgi:hypothetical protein